MPSILIVDDEVNIRNGLKSSLEPEGYHIFTASNGINALQILKNNKIDMIISDIKMPKMDGLTLQEEALKQYPDIIVILLTAYGTVETAVEAMRRGAYDFITKPINLDKLEMTISRAFEKVQISKENSRLKNELDLDKGLEDIIGKSPKMIELFEKIKAISETKSTVLVLGESGTGKELIASAIHSLSPRRNKPFIAVNCAALSENILESELFGHEKGAFTGAIQKKEGKFKLADQGTLFLDEVGELAPHIQVKLLRVLQEKTFEPVGATYSVNVDIRVLAATNRNLQQMVEEGLFREDLYYRLNVLKLESPPLRERKEDIPLLISFFLQQYCQEMNKTNKNLSSKALKAMTRYPWPGNVRELKNVIENLVVFARNKIIQYEDLPEQIITPLIMKEESPTINISDNEKRLIEKALVQCKYNKTNAAKLLGMSRRTIHRKIKEYGLET